MIDATGQDSLILKQRLHRWLVPWRRSCERGVEEGEWRVDSLAGYRGCVRDCFVRLRSHGAGRRAMSFAALVPGTVKAQRAAAKHVAFLFVSLDFAAQSVHVLGRDLRNVWRRALPASESSLSSEPRLEMYVRCDPYVRRSPVVVRTCSNSFKHDHEDPKDNHNDAVSDTAHPLSSTIPPHSHQ